MTAPTPGVRAVRDALQRRQEDLVEGLVTQAVVTAAGTNTVTVTFPGSTATQTWPRLRGYADAKAGDVAILLGRPGSWVALGALA